MATFGMCLLPSTSSLQNCINLALLQDIIYRDNPATQGTIYCPLVLDSDKTTVSVATGQLEYWPVYLSIGNIHNNVRRAH